MMEQSLVPFCFCVVAYIDKLTLLCIELLVVLVS